jgi:hypothetical protein
MKRSDRIAAALARLSFTPYVPSDTIDLIGRYGNPCRCLKVYRLFKDAA